MKTPCEFIVWYLLPGLRRTLAVELLENHGMTQAEIARCFEITQAAVSQYFSQKRGEIELPESMKPEIVRSAEVIANGDKDAFVRELCRLCELMKEKGVLDILRQQLEEKS